jgi:hypothetical protein
VRYYSSRKAQPVTIYLTAKKGAEDYGSSAIGIFQRPGPVAQSFFTVNPPRIAVNTLAGSEPIEAQLIATLYDANDNPVPDERVSFAIEPVEVVPYSDILAGDANNIILTRYDLTSLTPYFRAQGGPTAATNDWGPGGAPRGDRYLGFLRFVPSIPTPLLEARPVRPPLVSDGSIVQSEVMTDVNGVAMTTLQSVNICQPVTLKMVPQSNVALGRKFTTFYYVPVTSVQVTIEQGGLVNGPGSTFTVAFRFNPASALPVGTRVWVRIHGTAYDGDEDGDGLVNEDPPGANNWDDDKDGRIDEDPAGDANGDNNNDDDFDGQNDEDPFGPRSADDDGDGRVDEDWNPRHIDRWFTAVVTEPGVIRVSITNQATGPDDADGWKVIQVFVWNRDGIRLMGQTSAIEFRR